MNKINCFVPFSGAAQAEKYNYMITIFQIYNMDQRIRQAAEA